MNNKASSMPAQEPEPPFSCSTNLSNAVIEHLEQAHLGALAMRLCLRAHRQTFGNAGWHRKQGHSELSCQFDLALWAHEMGCDRSDLRKVREKLQACHILTFTAYPALPGCGLLTWQIASFADWLPYHQRVAKRMQADVVKLQPVPSETKPRLVATATQTKPRLTASSSLNKTTPACLEEATLQGPRAPVIKVTEEGITEERDVIAPIVQQHANMVPSARTASAAQGETYSALRKREEDEAERLRARISTLQTQIAQERDHKTLKELRLRLQLAQRELNELSDSQQAPPAPIVSEQQEALARAWLSEVQQIKIDTPAPDPTPLFPDAVPPEKPDVFGTVLSWFYDPAHVDARDKRKVAICLENLKQRGYNSIDELRTAYEHWKDRNRDEHKKRAGIFDFARNAAAI